jgi:gamma-glutamyltranspeptidase/glutathione hydrolase
MKRFFAAFLGLAFATGIVAAEAAAPASPVARRHMIVAAEPDAAEAGLAMLRAGGSAVDAAIAAQLVLTLVEPQSSGIGGGAYLIVSDGAALRAYDGRETAPASASPNMYLDMNGRPRNFRDVQYGGISVGVPGMIAVLAMAHREHGRLPWARLFAPAIALAENGFVVQPRLAREEGDIQRLGTMPDMRAAYFHADGTPIRPGEVLKNPAYAETLKTLAQGGANAFYRGTIADKIVASVTTAPVNPVRFTRADLAGYRAIEREPLCGTYRLYRVCGVPPSTSGGTTVLQILGLLERFPSEQLKPGTLTSVHLVSEASRLAYADRNHWLADPAFLDVPVQGLVDRAYLWGRSSLIDPMRVMRLAWPGTPPMRAELKFSPMPEQPSFGTSQLAAVDERGQVVSITMTVQAAFGSGLMPGGFILNNELTDFSFEPVIDGRAVANAPAAGKRPLSSMSPTIVFAPDGSFFAALGSPGGRQIIGYVAQALVNLIDGQMSMAETAAAPRHINAGGPTVIESGTPLASLSAPLSALGHMVRSDDFDSGINGIRRTAAGYEGGADPRREGVALGD